MELGKNLYVNLEVEGLEDKSPIKFLELVDLKVVETAGASLPYIYVAIISRDERVKNFIQQNNTVRVSLGSSKEDADTFSMNIDYPGDMIKDHMGGWLIEFAGFIKNSSYMIEQVSKTYQGNSLLVVNQVMKEYFGVPERDQDIEPGEISNELSESAKERVKSKKGGKYYIISDFKKTSEKQTNWIRTNETACSFVAKVLLHGDYRPSFPLFTFDKYGKFYIRDLSDMTKKKPKYHFVSSPTTKKDQIQYVNDFSVKSYKSSYNIYSGFNKITEIQDIKTGVTDSRVSKNSPILASTSMSEKTETGSIVQMNIMQSSNVHETYQECFEYNTNKAVSLSALMGKITLINGYYKYLKPLDLVSVTTSDENNAAIGGMYLIDTIITEADPSSGGIKTQVFLTRDNKNNVENYTNKKKRLRIRDDLFRSLSRAISTLSNAYAMCLKFMDGTYLNQMFSFLVATRTNLLRSFSIAGVAQDFTRQRGLLKSLVFSGNSLMNALLDMIFPEDVASTLKDFIIRRPSLISLIGDYVTEWVPYKLRFPIMYLVQSLFDTTSSLNNILKDNEDIVKEEITIEEDIIVEDYKTEGKERVNSIIQDFENNTTGLDIPFPIIPLTEAQSILPDNKLKEFVASKVIDNLTDLGYMDGVNRDELTQILLGDEPINFSLIDRINKNAGDFLFFRLWGTFETPIELSDFFIKKAYKDKFKTISCTKIISALGNKRIFFSCPKKEEDLRFYINSQRTPLESFDINLGYTNVLKEPVMYTVYYTSKGFNSSGVLFEVKQGGMV